MRQFLGYERMEYSQLVKPLREVCRIWSQWNNLYRVQLKQIEIQREDSRRIRKHDHVTALTPVDCRDFTLITFGNH